MRLGFFLRESFRALRRNAAPSFAAAIVVLLTTLVLGVFIPVMSAVTSKANEVRNKIELAVFTEPNATEAQLDELRNQLLDLRYVDSVEYLTPERGQAVLTERVPALSLGDAGNELRKRFPGTFLVDPTDPARAEEIQTELLPVGANGKPRPINPIIQENRGVIVREDESKKILSATNSIKIVVGVLSAMLIIASILLVANTIRLSIFARRREVEVMRLVGATNWFIRWPFVIEGVIVGLFGGVAAVALLWIVKVALVDPLSDRFALIAAPDTIGFGLLAVILLFAAMVVSAIGSGITLRRFLRI